jgi:hypothetical protein
MRKAFLLLLFAGYVPASSAQELKNVPHCGDPQNISTEFREIAGETFDIVGSLQEVELKGKIFYEPVLQNAEVAVRKATRKAITTDEQRLARCLESYKNIIDVYRSTIEFQSIPNAPKNPEFLNAMQKGQEEHKEGIHQALGVPAKQISQDTSSEKHISQPAISEMGRLSISSKPIDAELFVDGAFVGNAPTALQLQSGKHIVRVSLLGYTDWTKEITLMPASEANLVATLQKQK